MLFLENYLLVEIDKKYRDSDGSIMIDNTWHPEEYATQCGVVVSAPISVSGDFDRRVLSIPKAGDKVWFSYSVLFEYDAQNDNEQPVYRNMVVIDGKEYWKVHAGEVYCVERDGKVKMVTDNVLLRKEIRDIIEQCGGLEIYSDDSEDALIVVSAPEETGLSAGDKVLVEPRFLQKYEMLGGVHYIVRTRRVLGLAVNNN